MSRFSVPLRGFVVAVCVVLGSALPAAADPPVDPYLDAIAPGSTVVIDNPGALLGAPDGQFAKVSGQQFHQLVVDLGAGEEGVGDLEVTYDNLSPLPLRHSLYPEYLDARGRVLGQGNLVIKGTGPMTTTVHNPSTKPYRYIRILTDLNSYSFDSMKATALAQP